MEISPQLLEIVGISVVNRIKRRITENRVVPPSKKQGGTTLVQSGRLKNSIAHKVIGSQVKVGTNVVYARIHHEGGMAGRNRKVKIPARPYMFLDANDKDIIKNRIYQYYKNRGVL